MTPHDRSVEPGRRRAPHGNLSFADFHYAFSMLVRPRAQGAPSRDAAAEDLELERFGTLLRVLARQLLDARGQTAPEASELVARTLLDARARRAELRGSTDEELAAWLRQALSDNVIVLARPNSR